MKFNKIILFSLLLIALIGFGAVSASDDVNYNQDDLAVQHAVDDVTDEKSVKNIQINDDESDVLTVNYNGDNLENDKILKEEKAGIVITNETFSNYFDSEGKILDSVPEGSILDFKGLFELSDNIEAIYIDKSVTIISSSKDATIMLNTTNGHLGKENIYSRFIVEGVSEFSINDVTFNRTQILIYDSSYVNINNVSFISDNYRIIPKLNNSMESIPFIKFNNIDELTLKNSYLYVYNVGSRIIECNNTNEVLFDNNTFCCYAGISANKYYYDLGDRACENVIYIFEDNSSVNIVNNKFYGNATFKNFAYVLASNILFENNFEEHAEPHPSIYKICLGSDNSNVTVRNNDLLDLNVYGNAIVYNNVIRYHFDAVSVSLYNNSLGTFIEGRLNCSVVVRYNSIVFDNDIEGHMSIKGRNVILKNCNISRGLNLGKNINITVINNHICGNHILDRETIVFQSSEAYIFNNTIDGDIEIDKSGCCEIKDNIINGSIRIKSDLSIIQGNVINSTNDYAIRIHEDSLSNTYYKNNEISHNKIYSRLYCGDNAVLGNNNLNIIEDNTPTQIVSYLSVSVDAFEYGENTTVFINAEGVTGNATLNVGGEKYIVEIINGSASYVINRYDVGINNVLLMYENIQNDVMAINQTDFTVNKIAVCPIELIYDNASECKFANVKVVLPDDANGAIILKVSNDMYSFEIEKVASGSDNIIDLPGLFEGNYVISATFNSVKYVSNSTSGNISFVHVPVYELTANAVVMDYGDGSKYAVLVTKDGEAVGAGEIVNITFNGVTKSVKIDENGYATLTLSGAPKTYTIKAEYRGVTKSTKVTIKSILKASNISKKKSKQVKFSATLKNSKGKAIVGKKITFNFKGKTYTAKTNKKGVATITLKNLKVGKYAITSKYGACSVKNTIKIKK